MKDKIQDKIKNNVPSQKFWKFVKKEFMQNFTVLKTENSTINFLTFYPEKGKN